jgi:putative exporter of polyketide antibiotics
VSVESLDLAQERDVANSIPTPSSPRAASWCVPLAITLAINLFLGLNWWAYVLGIVVAVLLGEATTYWLRHKPRRLADRR